MAQPLFHMEIILFHLAQSHFHVDKKLFHMEQSFFHMEKIHFPVSEKLFHMEKEHFRSSRSFFHVAEQLIHMETRHFQLEKWLGQVEMAPCDRARTDVGTLCSTDAVSDGTPRS
jgi:hypothetical protein